MKNLLIPLISVIAVSAIIAAIGILLVISGFGKPKASPASSAGRPTPSNYFYEERNIPGTTTSP